MKSLAPIFVTILLIISLVSALAFINYNRTDGDKPLELVLRDIGHQLLLRSNDSVSRVLPVKRLDESRYQLSFQNNFVFVPDTLINLVHRELEKYNLPKEYLVTVMDCQKKETIFAYEISDKTGNLLPCTGRAQETGCYLIQIEFLNSRYSHYAWWLLSSIPLGLMFFYGKSKFRKKEAEVPITIHNDCINLGKFKFYAEKNLLKFGNEDIPLSEKETKSLKVFAENQNQVIERERLMKEIWEDEGIIVMSRNVDVLVSKLRKKLKEDAAIKIINVHGRGYKFMVE